MSISFKQKYNRIYHFGEVFNRIIYLEQNKPSSSETSKNNSLVKSYDKTSILKVCNYNQRKHLNFICCILNNIELPKLTCEIAQQREIIKYHLGKIY